MPGLPDEMLWFHSSKSPYGTFLRRCAAHLSATELRNPAARTGTGLHRQHVLEHHPGGYRRANHRHVRAHRASAGSSCGSDSVPTFCSIRGAAIGTADTPNRISGLILFLLHRFISFAISTPGRQSQSRTQSHPAVNAQRLRLQELCPPPASRPPTAARVKMSPILISPALYRVAQTPTPRRFRASGCQSRTSPAAARRPAAVGHQ